MNYTRLLELEEPAEFEFESKCKRGEKPLA